MIKQCEVCKKEFQVKPSHYNKRKHCSRICMSETYEKIMSGENNPNFRDKGLKKCSLCRNDFYSYNTKRKYCSHLCASKSNRVNGNFIKTEKKCPSCGVSFVSLKKNCDKCSGFRLKKQWRCIKCKKHVLRKRKFCSSKCRTVDKRKTIPCICCGILLERTLSEIRKSNNHFCSKICRYKKPEYNPNWKNGIKPITSLIRDSNKNKNLIKFILKRDKFTCQRCKKIGGQLEVDHIKKFSLIFNEFFTGNIKKLDKYEVLKKALQYKPFWDKDNLQVLCKKCNWEKEIFYRQKDRSGSSY